MYDSFLYGYGLTLALFNVLGEVANKKGNEVTRYFNYNNFLKTFLHAKYHKRILRDFNNYFDLNAESRRVHDKVKEFLIANEDEIFSNGFERWASQHIFTKDKSQLDHVIIYSYILYNYWYHLLYTQVLQEGYSIEFIKAASLHIEKSLKSKAKIFTTNFDTLLDQHLSPDHMHGTFALPLKEMQDVILMVDGVNDRFEYVYLFGTNGVEKRHRLNLIRDLKQDCYDLDFFYQEDLALGHMLIYGLSFGYNQIMPEDYLREHPEQKDFNLLRSVDGHILSRIDSFFEAGRISKVTISYHTSEDLDSLKNIVAGTKFNAIVEYKHSTEIFDFIALVR